MSVKLISTKCPDCGASIDVEAGRKQIFCTYCGAKILLNNENEYIHRIIDEASIKRTEADIAIKKLEMEEWQNKVAEKRKTRLKMAKNLFIVAVISAFLGLIGGIFNKELISIGLLSSLGFGIAGLGTFIDGRSDLKK